MNISNWMKRFAAIAGSALMGLMFTTGTYAAVEQVTAEVEFVTAVALTEVNALQFGLLDVAMGNTETVVISPDDPTTVTDASSNVAGGAQAAAKLTVTAVAAQTITILVDNVTAATGYALGTWLCNYDAAASDSACDGGGYTETSIASATLLIGATLTGNGSAALGTDNSTFDVTVLYQ